MKKRVHTAAGISGFVIILVFWLSTVLSEFIGSYQTIAAVKGAILWGMVLLIPCLVIAGALGMSMGRRREGPPILRKKRRMSFIALNGLLILVPSAFFLADRARVLGCSTDGSTVSKGSSCWQGQPICAF